MQIVGSAGIQCFSAPKIGVVPSRNGPIDAAADRYRGAGAAAVAISRLDSHVLAGHVLARQLEPERAVDTKRAALRRAVRGQRVRARRRDEPAHVHAPVHALARQRVGDRKPRRLVCRYRATFDRQL